MLTDFYTWRAAEKPDEEEFEDDDFEAEVAALLEDESWEDVPINEGQA